MCVNPVHVERVSAILAGEAPAPCTVVAFPLGALRTPQKVREAAEALELGARELDVVADLGAMKEGRWEVLEREVRDVVRAVDGRALVKVILETAALEEPEILRAARVAAGSGADFLKTSTGFHPAGGATPEAVALLRGAAGPGVGIKASGGIRTCEAAFRLVAAGATRLGTSRGVELAGCREPPARDAMPPKSRSA